MSDASSQQIVIVTCEFWLFTILICINRNECSLRARTGPICVICNSFLPSSILKTWVNLGRCTLALDGTPHLSLHPTIPTGSLARSYRGPRWPHSIHPVILKDRFLQQTEDYGMAYKNPPHISRSSYYKWSSWARGIKGLSPDPSTSRRRSVLNDIPRAEDQVQATTQPCFSQISGAISGLDRARPMLVVHISLLERLIAITSSPRRQVRNKD